MAGGRSCVTKAFSVRAQLRKAWEYVRAVMGDQAYERYLEVAKRKGTKPLSAKEFYVDSIKRRYSTMNRCC